MKATAGKGKVSDIRKVTNSIIAQSGMKKVSTGRTSHALHGEGARPRVLRGAIVKTDTERRGVVRCAALSGRTAGTAPHALHSKAQPRLHLRGGQCFCALAVKRGRRVQDSEVAGERRKGGGPAANAAEEDAA